VKVHQGGRRAKVSSRSVFITGGTGYVGQRLAAVLIARGHRVRVLARPQSAARVAEGAEPVIGDALDAKSYAGGLTSHDTLVHLVGTPHPSPAKAAEFRRVDLPSIEAAVSAASAARLSHLVYVSVAHPAPIMQAYIEVRSAGEAAIARAGLTATVVRPWYVLGPGHWWPIALIPGYALLEIVPSTRATARRLGLVTIGQMVRTLVSAVEQPPDNGSMRIVEVPAIRRGSVASGQPVIA
jgi:uncharacterized protein YbjT (DUF2867 family)